MLIQFPRNARPPVSSRTKVRVISALLAAAILLILPGSLLLAGDDE
jgi:hypothetical protein